MPPHVLIGLSEDVRHGGEAVVVEKIGIRPQEPPPPVLPEDPHREMAQQVVKQRCLSALLLMEPRIFCLVRTLVRHRFLVPDPGGPQLCLLLAHAADLIVDLLSVCVRCKEDPVKHPDIHPLAAAGAEGARQNPGLRLLQAPLQGLGAEEGIIAPLVRLKDVRQNAGISPVFASNGYCAALQGVPVRIPDAPDRHLGEVHAEEIPAEVQKICQNLLPGGELFPCRGPVIDFDLKQTRAVVGSDQPGL